ncbi:hypothetical protein [Pandoraea capi]|uniref:hypothetical protein n=1 Tax=Pandoraea capi TaxID=2508286 RepID=UPI001241BF31|nr:hypothetical protein [Pandoraea capi]
MQPNATAPTLNQAAEVRFRLNVEVDKTAVDKATDAYLDAYITYRSATLGAMRIETERVVPVCLSCGACQNDDGTLPCDH